MVAVAVLVAVPAAIVVLIVVVVVVAAAAVGISLLSIALLMDRNDKSLAQQQSLIAQCFSNRGVVSSPSIDTSSKLPE